MLCIGDTGDSLVQGGPTHWPSGLSDPNGLAGSSGLSLTNGVVEFCLAVGDVVGSGGLEVRVCVHGEEVNGFSDGRVAGVSPGSPGVDVSDLST